MAKDVSPASVSDETSVTDVSSVSEESSVSDAEPSPVVAVGDDDEPGEEDEEEDDVDGEAGGVKLLVEGPPMSPHAWFQLSVMPPRPSLKVIGQEQATATTQKVVSLSSAGGGDGLGLLSGGKFSLGVFCCC